jgi:hypothetical protein
MIIFGGIYLWNMYRSFKYSTQNWNTYLSQKGKYSFQYPDTKMYFHEGEDVELHAYRLPPREKVPFNIQIQYTPQSTEQTNAATVLKNCTINKKRELKTTDATFEIFENAKCGNSFDTEIDVHANNDMVYLISIPDAVETDFLNSFLSRFIFYSQPPQNLPSISPTPVFHPFAKMSQPATDLDSPWKMYENERFGFSLSYPGNWRKKEEFSGEGDLYDIVSLQGDEGAIRILFSSNNSPINCGPGVTYNTLGNTTSSWESLQLRDQKVTACHILNNGSSWRWLFHKTLPVGVLDFSGTESQQTNADRDIILRIFSTLEFTR